MPLSRDAEYRFEKVHHNACESRKDELYNQAVHRDGFGEPAYKEERIEFTTPFTTNEGELYKAMVVLHNDGNLTINHPPYPWMVFHPLSNEQVNLTGASLRSILRRYIDEHQDTLKQCVPYLRYARFIYHNIRENGSFVVESTPMSNTVELKGTEYRDGWQVIPTAEPAWWTNINNVDECYGEKKLTVIRTPFVAVYSNGAELPVYLLGIHSAPMQTPRTYEAVARGETIGTDTDFYSLNSVIHSSYSSHVQFKIKPPDIDGLVPMPSPQSVGACLQLYINDFEALTKPPENEKLACHKLSKEVQKNLIEEVVPAEGDTPAHLRISTDHRFGAHYLTLQVTKQDDGTLFALPQMMAYNADGTLACDSVSKEIAPFVEDQLNALAQYSADSASNWEWCFHNIPQLMTDISTDER